MTFVQARRETAENLLYSKSAVFFLIVLFLHYAEKHTLERDGNNFKNLIFSDKNLEIIIGDSGIQTRVSLLSYTRSFKSFKYNINE